MSLYGGLLYETQGHGSAEDVVDSLARGGSIERPGPDARRDDAAAKRDAAATTRRKRRILAARPGRASLVPAGAVLILVAAGWSLVSQVAYPHTPAGKAGTMWALFGGLVGALGGARLLKGRGILATLACTAAGLALVLSASLLDHGGTRPRIWRTWFGLV